jgi:hypothetical protein
VGRQLGELGRLDQNFFRYVHVAEVAGDVDVLAHRAADHADLAPHLDGNVDRLLHAVDVRRKAGDEHPPLASGDDLAESLADKALRAGEAGSLRVGGVAEE